MVSTVMGENQLAEIWGRKVRGEGGGEGEEETEKTSIYA